MATVRLQLRRGIADDWFDANPTLAAGEIGIETDTNTFKFGDGDTPWNDLEYALSGTVDDYIELSTKGVAGGVASLDGSGFVPVSQLPPLVKVTVNAVADQSARLALTAEAGDIAIQADNGQSYVLSASPASTDENWKALVGSEAVVDTVEAALVAGTGLDKTYNDASGTITIDIDSTVATKTYSDQSEADAISTAAADATSKVAAEASLRVSGDASSVSTAAADATTKANAAQAAAEATASAALSAHSNDTTSIHGIADTSILATTTGTQTLTNKTLTSPSISTPTGIVKADVGLSNVDNTSDLNKPVSTAQASAIAVAKSESQGYTDEQINTLIGAAPSALNTLSELADALNDDASFASTVTSNLATKAPLASPTFTGTVGLPEATTIGQVSNVEIGYLNGVTSSIQGQIDDKLEISTAASTYAPLDSPTLTGTVTLPESTTIGEVSNLEIGYLNGVTSSIQGQIDLKAPLASPTFTGTVTLPANTILQSMMNDNSVGTAEIISSSITEAKIANNSVTESKIADGSVTSAKIATGAIVNEDINAAAAIEQSKIDGLSTSFGLKANLASPTFTGTVTLPSTTSIGNVSSTEIGYVDGVTSAIQTQIDAKSPTASPTFTGTVTLPSTTSIGNVSSTEIGYVDGVTSAIQTQLNAKAPTASPTFTGTVSGITKTMVGLGNVDNTSDDSKPVSTATQTALDLKANLASPTFTGTVTLPSTTSIGNVSSTEIGYVDGVTSAIQTQIDAKAASSTVTSHISGTTSVHGISDTAQLAYKNAANQTFTGNLEVDGNMTVDGNLTVNGTSFNASATSITIEDNMVQLAHQNAANTVDLGLIVAYNDGTTKHAGIVRDVSANKWKLFEGVTDEPATTVNFAQGTLDDLEVADITASSATIGNVSNTEIGYLDGVTSAIQTQLNAKAPTASPTFTGTVSGITKTMVGLGNVDNTSDASKPVSTATQTALDAKLATATAASTYETISNVALKAPLASPTFTGTVTLPSTTSIGNVSSTEIGYVDGVTSAIQTQLNAKAPTASPTFTGTVTVAASGIVFTDGTQTKQGVPSLTTIGTEISAAYNLSTGGLALRDQLIPIAGTQAVTIPANATLAWPIGGSVDFYQASGTGANFVAAAGVTILRTPGLKLRTTHSSATLTKVNTDIWLLAGDLTA